MEGFSREQSVKEPFGGEFTIARALAEASMFTDQLESHERVHTALVLYSSRILLPYLEQSSSQQQTVSLQNVRALRNARDRLNSAIDAYSGTSQDPALKDKFIPPGTKVKFEGKPGVITKCYLESYFPIDTTPYAIGHLALVGVDNEGAEHKGFFLVGMLKGEQLQLADT